MFKKIWDFLNGNKTVIGGALLVIAEILPNKQTALYAILQIVGGILTGGGILHKYAKGEIPMLKRKK